MTASSGEAFLKVGDVANLDVVREVRTGIPEIILAEGKLDSHLVQIVKALGMHQARVIVSRLAPERLALFENMGFTLDYAPDARILIASRGGTARPRTGGRVLILAAGTADIPVAQEAQVVAEELGCETRLVPDVGVAGIHRLFPELDYAQWADAIIVAAGREGALGPVVAGLVDRPVIGLPVSTGYGLGGAGEAALFTMLQSCSPMLAVNIDAGVVAGACAAQIANRVAWARNTSPSESRSASQEALAAATLRREQP